LAPALAALALAFSPFVPAADAALARIETAYADLNDAAGALALIDSGFRESYAGTDREGWARRLERSRGEFESGLARIASGALPAEDARALEVMRAGVAALSEETPLAPQARCARASDVTLALAPLRAALYACFAEIGNRLEFEGAAIERVAALDRLARLRDAGRRKAVFDAFLPLWRAVNGAGEADSPYRRLIRMAAAEQRRGGSPIAAAAAAIDATPAAIESWLERILEAWRQADGAAPIEPWDLRYVNGAAERALGPAIGRADLEPASKRYYRDLGADLDALGVLNDLDPRPGKAPLAYTDYVRRGRLVNGAWQATEVRVSGSYARGGLGLLNELVHEHGHAVHMLALRTRPAFMDLGEAVFYEAFADVPSWATYEPAWQTKYLGRAATESESLRSLFGNVVLDVAWALFEMRMLRAPDADPNRVWTDITHTYLHVVPHPELAWWAVRVQLVDTPGYMVNYGLGAILTADLRRRIESGLGPFATGDPRWFEWISRHLLESGAAQPAPLLLREFLGRPVTPDALIDQLHRLARNKGRTRGTAGVEPAAADPGSR
jgi:hypothetical protein